MISGMSPEDRRERLDYYRDFSSCGHKRVAYGTSFFGWTGCEQGCASSRCGDPCDVCKCLEILPKEA